MKKMTIMVILVLLFGISLAIIIPFNLINKTDNKVSQTGNVEQSPKAEKNESEDLVPFGVPSDESLDSDYVDNGVYPYSNPPEIYDDGSIVFDGMTVTELTNKLNKSLRGFVTNTGYLFADYTRKTGLDPYLAVAIMLHESGCNGTCSNLAVNYYNFGGFRSTGSNWYHYDTFDEGMNAFLNVIYNNYYSQGLTTPEAIVCKYNACSEHWVSQVRDYMNTIRNR